MRRLRLQLSTLALVLLSCSVEPTTVNPLVPKISEPIAQLQLPEPEQTPEEVLLESVDVPAAERSLWARLQAADTRYFVLMRHALAPGTGDPANFQLDNCATQRNLSAEGRAQAERTGELFRQQNIPVTQVLSSQWCRCLDTATLMALGPVEPFPALNSFFRDRRAASAQTDAVAAFMRQNPNTSGVTVMVTHFVNISALTNADVSSGEMVVMQVAEDGQLAVLGSLEAL